MRFRSTKFAGFLLVAAAVSVAWADEPDRSPVDLALSPDGQWLVTANQTSNTVSLVRTSDGKLLDELPVGQHPTYVSVTPDGRTWLISNSYSGDITLVEVANNKLQKLAAVDVGFEPHGIAVGLEGKLAYVALTAADQVAVVDLAERRVTDRIDVGRWPRYLALSPDGMRLAVGCSGDRGVAVIDTATRKQLFLESFQGLNIGHLQVAKDGNHVYFPWVMYRHNPINPNMIRLGWVLGTRIARVRLDGPARREAMSLDPQGKAVGDPFGLALTPDEQRLVSSASGTHELLVYRLPDLPLSDYGNLDHIDPKLLGDHQRFARIHLGGRPMGLRAARDNRTVYVANHLLNCVQVVDLDERVVRQRIDLGGPPSPTSLARRGEAIFYDATRSLDQWYSCHTCHYEGGSNAERMDTWNDGTANTYKTVLSLTNLHETGPWTWHGWQKGLPDAMRSSLTTTMQGSEPSDEDVTALLAFFKQLRPAPNPFRPTGAPLSPAAERGEKVFQSEKAACATCHSGPLFTDGQIHDVGLGSAVDRYQGFNTPSLVGVFRKVRLLHDGRARSLEQLLTGPHSPAKVTGKGELTEDERKDLIEYLKTL